MKLTTTGPAAASDQTRFNRASLLGAWYRDGGEQQEAVEVGYIFNFAPDEVVTATDDPFRPLHFWREAKDKFMRLLGYRHQTQWQDPTSCLPHHYSRYVKILPPGPMRPMIPLTGRGQ